MRSPHGRSSDRGSHARSAQLPWGHRRSCGGSSSGPGRHGGEGQRWGREAGPDRLWSTGSNPGRRQNGDGAHRQVEAADSGGVLGQRAGGARVGRGAKFLGQLRADARRAREATLAVQQGPEICRGHRRPRDCICDGKMLRALGASEWWFGDGNFMMARRFLPECTFSEHQLADPPSHVPASCWRGRQRKHTRPRSEKLPTGVSTWG